MVNQIGKLKYLGQSAWIDFIDRDYISSGEFESAIVSGMSGITSNPSILSKAIEDSESYSDQIQLMVDKNKDSLDIYDDIIKEDISAAADLLYPVYVSSDKKDGYVSIEVDPCFANRVDATVYQGSYLFNLIDKENIMIKIPATEAGILSMKKLVSCGINVNMTLIFSVEQYCRVAEAYLDALQTRLDNGFSINSVSSVASFFVSRIDTKFDQLSHVIKSDGKVAIAVSKMVYDKYYHLIRSPRFKDLKNHGAMPQRVLWASVSSKNSEYDSLIYVKNLIAKDTVITIPPKTLIETFAYPGEFRPMLELYRTYDAETVLDKVAKLGIDLSEIGSILLDEGIAQFVKSFDSLMSNLYYQSTAPQRYEKNN